MRDASVACPSGARFRHGLLTRSVDLANLLSCFALNILIVQRLQAMPLHGLGQPDMPETGANLV